MPEEMTCDHIFPDVCSPPPTDLTCDNIAPDVGSLPTNELTCDNIAPDVGPSATDESTCDTPSQEARSHTSTNPDPHTTAHTPVHFSKDHLDDDLPAFGYDVLSELGRGGMGIVYLAQQRGLNRKVALKVVLAGHRAGDVLRFLAEAEAVAAVKHPNVVQVYEYGEANGLPYMAMEYLPGNSLADRLKDAGHLSPTETAKLVIKVAAGVQAAHEQQIVHRDLKPGNVLFDEYDEPKVTDFGLAKRPGGTDLTANGERLAAAAQDGSIRVIDENPLHENVVVIREHKGAVRAVAFSPDGTLATAGEDGTLRLWELLKESPMNRNAGSPLYREKPGPKIASSSSIQALSYSADGQLLAWADTTGAVVVWEVGAKEPRELGRHEGTALALTFSPDGKRLATAGADRKIRIWSTTGENSFTLEPCQGPIVGIAWRADGQQLAAVVEAPGQSGEIVVFDLDTKRPIRTLGGPPGGLVGVAYHPDGRLVATGRDGSVRLWTADGTTSLVLRGSATLNTAPRIRSNGKSIAVGGTAPEGTGQVTVWNLTAPPVDLVLSGPVGGATALAFTPDSERLVSSGNDGLVKIWDMATGRETQSLRGHDGPVLAVAASPHLLRIASAGHDGTVRLWDLSTGENTQVLKGHDGPMNAVAFGPDGTWLVSADHAGNVIFWDTKTARQIRTFHVQEGAVHSIAVSPDGKHLATAGADRIVRIWDAVDEKVLYNCRGHTASVTSVAFSPDGTRLVSVSADRTVRLWDATNGTQIHAMTGHAAAVTSVTCSPDGRRVGSAGADGAVKLWDTESGLEVFTLSTSAHRVAAVVFDSQFRLAAATDSTIKVWQAASSTGPIPTRNQHE